VTVSVAVAVAGNGIALAKGTIPDTEKQVEQLLTDRVAEPYAMFDDAMRAAIGQAQLADLLAKEKASRGKLRSVKADGEKAKGDYRIVHATARFERGRPLKFTISYRTDGKIAGLNFVPGAGEVAEANLKAAIAAMPGRIGVAAWVAERPQVAFRHDAGARFSAGSQFKVLILARAAELAASGSLRLDDRIEI